MNKAKVWILLGALLLCTMIMSVSAQETIRIASGEWAPYQSENLKYYGVASRIVTEAFALEGIKVEYGYFPWKRAFNIAETGEWDGTFLWFDTPERRKIFYISDSVIDIQYVFFHLKDYPFDWHSIDDLKGIAIGGTLQYHYGDEFQSAEKAGKIKVHRVSQDLLNFRKLLSGRIHIFPNEIDAGLDLIQKNFTPDQIKLFTYHPKPVKAAPHHLLLSKMNTRNKSRIELFNKGLKRLKQNGKLDQYLAESQSGKYSQ